jgi:hypothetical protein
MYRSLSSSSSGSNCCSLSFGGLASGVHIAAVPPDPRPWGLGPKFRNPSYGDVSVARGGGRAFSCLRGAFLMLVWGGLAVREEAILTGPTRLSD